jgi:ABC-2 type transport system permease protein
MVLNLFKGWAPAELVDTVASMSFLTHFASVSKGVIGLRDIFYFLSLIGVWLAATTIIIEVKQAD